jgi:fused signal recognition particle receptor
MVGVNGTGKTTTAGKLSRLLVSEGKQVMLGAADTFRAAAADQLETWGAKVGVPVVRSDKDGADPASVAFEASAKAKEENVDVLIIDTAGRLQNKANLMDELGKIRRVTEKNLPVDEVLLVLDATTGQNGMTQAKVFAEAIGITGVVLSKLRQGRHRDFRAEGAWRARQARRPRRRPGRPRPVRSGRLRRRHPRLTFPYFPDLRFP